MTIKLKEQKPTDKVKPKFKVGDWIVYDNDKFHAIALIVAIDYDMYKVELYNDIKVVLHTDYINYIDKNYHLWTIKDAKDGDVLAWNDSKCIALFKNIYDEESFNSHGFVGHCTGVFESRLSYHDIVGAHPATKEQRDILLQKMKEAGYAWDAEKKELKKIDQKPIDNIKSKFKVGDKIVYRGNLYKIIDVTRTPYNRFIYDVDIMNILTDPEDVVTSIGPAGEDQMLRYND